MTQKSYIQDSRCYVDNIDVPNKHLVPAQAETPSATPAKYIHGGWSHIFHDNGPDVSLRFVLETMGKYTPADQPIIAMELLTSHGWTIASKGEILDVQDSLLTANEDILVDPTTWGLSRSDELPDWAVKYIAPVTCP